MTKFVALHAIVSIAGMPRDQRRARRTGRQDERAVFVWESPFDCPTA